MEMNGTIVIERPVDTVFDYVIDLSNDANWRTGVDESGWQSGESLGLGALGYTLAGSQKVEWRVVSYTAGERVDWELISGPLRGRGGYRLVPMDGGTEFTSHFTFRCGNDNLMGRGSLLESTSADIEGVPDGGATIALMGFGLLSLIGLRRRF